MVIKNSLRQLMRTPVKTFFFLILLVLTVAFFMLGFNLWSVSKKNMDKIESTFTTIGTVQQKATAIATGASWDGWSKTYRYFSHPTYNSLIPPSVLDFEGANYIVKPEKRPYYVAYSSDYVVDENPYTDIILDSEWLIVEMQPFEDCVPSAPARMKVTKVLSGDLGYSDEIYFVDFTAEHPKPMYARKTYIIALAYAPGFLDYDLSAFMPGDYPYSTQRKKDGTRIKDLIEVDTVWDEVTEGFYDTPIGRRWLALIEAHDIVKHTIPVIPTQDTNLLMSFFDGNTWISAGRMISKEEFKNGEKVCLVSQYFAENNKLKVGDSLRLPLFSADYRDSSSSTYRQDAYIGSPRGSLLNADGEIYPVFEDSEYEIVGLYQAVQGASSSPDYMPGKNAVVIPSASVKHSDENNILSVGPMMGYSTSFQIPNGTADEYLAAWARQGINDLEINFYDKGYSKLKAGLDAMAATAAILLIAGGATTLLVLLLFCHLFIARQRKRTAIERSLGMATRQCATSLLVGILVVVIPACIIGGLVSGWASGYAYEQINASQTEEAFDTTFSDWVNGGDAQNAADFTMNTRAGMDYAYMGTLFIPVALLIALIYIRGNLRSEPLMLLSENER